MRYFDILIPFLTGLVRMLYPAQLVKASDGAFEKKKALLKKCGIAFIGIAILLFILRYYQPEPS